MKPIVAAYQVFQETEPFLPSDVVETTQVLSKIS